MKDIYYEAPADEVFEEMRKACKEQWHTHDNTYGYVDEKWNRIKNITNVEDNFMYMLAMFDTVGQTAVIARLSEGARHAVRIRLIAGGNPLNYLAVIGL